MSHQEKQRIFDEYAKSNGFDCWNELQSTCDIIILKRHIFRACDLVQEEQQKRIKERISNSEFQKGHPVDISSIINPENIIS